jgi:CubicO group peptidase (beta-lactamase class C family)
LLTHTSEGVPGNNYKYNGDRYSLLSNVIQSATGETFHKLANDRIMQPLGLQNTAPSDMRLAALDGFDIVKTQHLSNKKNLKRLALLF